MNKRAVGWKSGTLTSEALQPQLRHHCCTVHFKIRRISSSSILTSGFLSKLRNDSFDRDVFFLLLPPIIILIRIDLKVILIHIGLVKPRRSVLKKKTAAAKEVEGQLPATAANLFKNEKLAAITIWIFLRIKNCRNQFGAAAHKQKPGLIIACHCEVRASKKFPLI